MYDLIIAGPQSQKDPGYSVNATDGKERDEEVDLHVQIYAILGDDVLAYVEEQLEVAKLNIIKGRLGQADCIIHSMKQWLISNFGNDVARSLCDHIDEVCSQQAL